MFIGKILKDGITGVVNPYQPGLSFWGDGFRVLAALDVIYLSEGNVFQGSIRDHIRLADAANIPEIMVFSGFQELRDHGWITLDGEIFTPTEQLLDRYLVADAIDEFAEGEPLFGPSY